jgi:hypothetical protein
MARQGKARDAAEMTRGPIKSDPKAKKALSALDVNPGKMDFARQPKFLHSHLQVAQSVCECKKFFRGSRHNSLLAAASK